MILPRILKMIGLAAWVLLPGPYVHAHQRQDLGSRNTLFEVRRAFESFHRTYGVYPPQTNWMNEVLAREPAPINRGMKIFSDASYGSPPIRDGWGKDFVYLLPGIRNPQSFDLYSLGADGETRSNGDDPDDLAAWHSSGRMYWHYEPVAYVMTSRVMGLIVLAIGGVFLVRRIRRKRSKFFQNQPNP